MFPSQKKKWPAVLNLMQVTRSPQLVWLPSRLYSGLRLSLRVWIESKSVEVSSCVDHPLLMLEVKRWECCKESEWDILSLRWKLRGGNVMSPNEAPHIYIGGWEEKMLYWVRIACMLSRNLTEKEMSSVSSYHRCRNLECMSFDYIYIYLEWAFLMNLPYQTRQRLSTG